MRRGYFAFSATVGALAAALIATGVAQIAEVSQGDSNSAAVAPKDVGIVSQQEGFDGVTAPAFPASWTPAIAPAADPALWVTTTTASDTAPNNAFGGDPAHITDNTLTKANLFGDPVANRRAVAFRNFFNLEDAFDGGVLEISIPTVNGGAFTDIVAAGGRFVNNGYNGTISANFQNPLAGRPAWTGNSATYVRSVAILPDAHVGQSFMLRWRLGSDITIGAAGWHIDEYRLIRWPHWNGDVSYDAKTDRTIFRSSTGTWYTAINGGAATTTVWGTVNDIDVPGDFDGDGKMDICVFRPSTGTWYIIQSSNGSVRIQAWGAAGDIPLAGDFDSDGKDDLVVYRNGSWFTFKSGGGTAFLGWGGAGDQPLLADFDGDGTPDPTVFRPSNGFWYSLDSTLGGRAFGWGQNGDIPVPDDRDGDGKADYTVWRPSTGQWFVSNSLNGSSTVLTWGVVGDVPVFGDFDGDGRADFNVWRPGGGHWFTLFARGGSADVSWGSAGDSPIGRRPGS